MDKIERTLTYIYSNLEVFNPVLDYVLDVYDIYCRYKSLTPEEYVSIIWSYEFNTKQQGG